MRYKFARGGENFRHSPDSKNRICYNPSCRGQNTVYLVGVNNMWRFILITFGFLGYAFYELSGGAAYEPRNGSLQDVIAQRRIDEANKATALAALNAAKAKPAALAAVAPSQPAPQTGEAKVILASAPAEAPTPAKAKAKAKPVTLVNPLINSEKANALTAAAPAKDIRSVIKTKVNLRSGPGTSYDRMGQLNNGAKVEILEDFGDGWVKMRVLDSGKIAYVADFLLSAPTTELASN